MNDHFAGVAEDDVITVPDIEDIIKKGCSTVGSTGVGIDRVKEFIASILPPLQTMAKNIQVINLLAITSVSNYWVVNKILLLVVYNR